MLGTGKLHLKKVLFFTFLCLLAGFQGFAQEKGATLGVEVRGLVTENDKRLPGAVVTVMEGGNTVNTINTSDGRFSLHLDPDKDYIITFSKSGYITKRISF